jgi:hypothetical protein
MFGKPLRATPGAIPAFALTLCLLLPAWSLAQRSQPPEPATPETTPGPSGATGRPAGPGGYAASETPAEAVKRLELLRFKAMVEIDKGTLDRVLGEDLTYTHSTGEVDTKAHFLEILGSDRLRYLALTPGEVKVRMIGEAAAVVTGRIAVRVSTNGKDLSFPARFLSVYARRHGHWLLVAWQSTRAGS